MCNGLQVDIDKDTRHNLYYGMIRSFLENGVLKESENFEYGLKHKNTNTSMTITKKYIMDRSADPLASGSHVIAQNDVDDVDDTSNADVLDDDIGTVAKKLHTSEVKDPQFTKTKNVPIRYHTITTDEIEENEIVQYARYKMTNESSDCIEQVPMIKLYMILLLTIDYVRYRVVYRKSEDTNDMEARVEFKFWFYDRETDKYDKKVIISVDNSILVGRDGLPIIVRTQTKEPQELTERDMLIHLYMKALILLVKTIEIDLERANVNSFVGAARGGRLYKVSLDSSVDIDTVDLSLRDVAKRKAKENQHRTRNNSLENGFADIDNAIIWTDNIFEALAMFNPEYKYKRTRDDYANKLSQRANRKKASTPYSNYSRMIKNMYDSDCLIGVMGGNTFLYMVHDIRVPISTSDLIISFVNPLRGNPIDVNIQSVLSGIQRMGLVLDSQLLSQIR